MAQIPPVGQENVNVAENHVLIMLDAIRKLIENAKVQEQGFNSFETLYFNPPLDIIKERLTCVTNGLKSIYNMIRIVKASNWSKKEKHPVMDVLEIIEKRKERKPDTNATLWIQLQFFRTELDAIYNYVSEEFNRRHALEAAIAEYRKLRQDGVSHEEAERHAKEPYIRKTGKEMPPKIQEEFDKRIKIIRRDFNGQEH